MWVTQAEKKITAEKLKQIKKITIIFNQKGQKFEWKWFSFFKFAQLCQQLFFSQLEINHMIYHPTAWTDVDNLGLFLMFFLIIPVIKLHGANGD
jgi:hypothetical protein